MEWISCFDKMPELNQYVLVYSSLGIRLLSLRLIKEKIYWVENNGFSMKLDTLEATHWMPLPATPAKEGE